MYPYQVSLIMVSVYHNSNQTFIIFQTLSVYCRHYYLAFHTYYLVVNCMELFFARWNVRFYVKVWIFLKATSLQQETSIWHPCIRSCNTIAVDGWTAETYVMWFTKKSSGPRLLSQWKFYFLLPKKQHFFISFRLELVCFRWRSLGKHFIW